MFVKIAIFLLRNRSLTEQESFALSRILLKDFGITQIFDIIKVDEENQILVRGNPISVEDAIKLRASADMALQNQALKLVNEQLNYAAVVGGLHNAESYTPILFFRAALWYSQQQRKHLELLAQKEQEPTLSGLIN